jgi:proline dehydrogenase
VRRLTADRVAASLDFFGEQVADASEATRVGDAYVDLARAAHDLPEGTSLAVDLSHIGLDVSTDLCAEQLQRILSAMPQWCRIDVGAEDATRTDRILDVVLRSAAAGARIMATLQANMRRSAEDAGRLAAARVPVRLVKGAYVEPQHIALPWGAPTDAAYVRLADQLHRAGVEVALATHDAGLRDALLLAMPGSEIQMLMGVRSDDARALAARGDRLRLYVPFGPNWTRYWLRRIAESRGA